jgi:hypothetical protein
MLFALQIVDPGIPPFARGAYGAVPAGGYESYGSNIVEADDDVVFDA